MTDGGRHAHMDAARVHAKLSVQDLWLRYLALGGTSDAFDLDGYLQALVPLHPFQQDVLAQALNEALHDACHGYRVPQATPPDDSADDRLRQIIDTLLDGRAATVQAWLTGPEEGPAGPAGA